MSLLLWSSILVWGSFALKIVFRRTQKSTVWADSTHTCWTESSLRKKNGNISSFPHDEYKSHHMALWKCASIEKQLCKMELFHIYISGFVNHSKLLTHGSASLPRDTPGPLLSTALPCCWDEAMHRDYGKGNVHTEIWSVGLILLLV